MLFNTLQGGSRTFVYIAKYQQPSLYFDMGSKIKPSTVLIVGAGIAGPALALLLRQKGYLPTVVEKVRDMGEVGVALSLHPNG